MKEADKKKNVTSSSSNVTQPVSTQQSTSNVNSDGIRHRNTNATSGQPTVVQPQPINPMFNPNMLYAMQPPFNVATITQNPNSPDYLAAQQAAMQTWMQQAYAQYFNQYMNM